MAFEDGTGLSLVDDGQSCCENRYMTCDDNLDYFVGAEYLGWDLGDVEFEGEKDYLCKDIQFLNIRTSRGVISVASHNDHSGYYDGFNIKEVTS